MFDRLMIGYIAFYMVVVVLAAAIGAVGCLLLTDRRRDRLELEADITAAEDAPVTGRVVASLDPDPYALPAAPEARTELEITASTGDLHWVRQQLDLDDYALAMEQEFHALREQTRATFEAIRVPA